MDRRGSDQTAVHALASEFLVEVQRMGIANDSAILVNGLQGEGVGNGLARFTGDDVVPGLAQLSFLPEVSLECVLCHEIQVLLPNHWPSCKMTA
ncbi:hypothetical protein D3C87_1546860 [compost metagenome]